MGSNPVGHWDFSLSHARHTAGHFVFQQESVNHKALDFGFSSEMYCNELFAPSYA